jgi:hypothetical protein
MRRLLVAFLFLCGGAHQAAAAPLDEQMRAVEAIRGLTFTAPVKSVTINRAELPARLQEQFEKGLPYPVSDWETILETLLLVDDSGKELLPALLDLYEEQVLAYYDPLAKTYYAIREMPKTASSIAPAAEVLEESVALHELMHALQDQRFDIGTRSWAIRNDNDATMAYHALLEGEATLVMLASLVGKVGGSLDDALKNEMLVSTLASAATSDVMAGSGAPPYFTEMLKFPYLQGLNFVIAAYQRGGWKEIDRIHRNPPRSTREILHPTEYFERTFVPAKWSDTPAAAVTRFLSVEHLGEFHWGFLLGADVARGWRADRVTIAADAACAPTVLAETEWDSPEIAARFHAAYTALLDAKGHGSLTRVDGSRVRVAYGTDRVLMEKFTR